MAQKIRIKDIAEMAGVSPGTVDRVLHNRGNVSASSRAAIEAALERVNYQPNIHISALSLKRSYRIVVTMPGFVAGEYWDLMHRGISLAMREYESIDIEYQLLTYDQFDLYSCRETFGQLAGLSPDAVIIGPTFREETIELTRTLEEKKIPYVYVDSMIEGTSPLAFFSSDQYKCGYLISKMITSICPEASHYGLFQAVRIGDESANTTILRKEGFMAYCREHGLEGYVEGLSFSVGEPERNDDLIGDYFTRHPEVRGVVVLNSRGNIIGDYLRRKGVRDVKVVCVDMTEKNVAALKDGKIDFVIGQRSAQQGFMALQCLIQYLIYGNPVKVDNYLPLDIITQENLDFYDELPGISRAEHILNR